MAAPTPTVRQTPAGIKLKDGFRFKVTFSADPDISLWEVELNQGGADLGEPVDQSTMWNDTYVTRAPQGLQDWTQFTLTFAYDPAVITQLAAIIGTEQTMTVTYKDGSTLAIYGWINSTNMGTLARGSQPRGTLTFQPSNWDDFLDVEAGPAVASVGGT
jgi:hypothetical protein